MYSKQIYQQAVPTLDKTFCSRPTYTATRRDRFESTPPSIMEAKNGTASNPIMTTNTKTGRVQK